MTALDDLVVLRWLARRGGASEGSIGAACAMGPGEVRARLTALERLGHVSGRGDGTAGPHRRVFAATDAGRRRLGIVGRGERDG